MPRQPRFDLPGYPQHVVQRGNNRLPCFLDDEDRQRYLQFLHRSASREGCRIHAYVLMSNHVHLLCTPEQSGGISRMMQALGRSYVGLFNTRHARTGTLWEGRFRASLVESDRYLLACYRYIEMNPVRGFIVSRPDAYAWSSHASNALGRHDGLLTPHACYEALGQSDVSRRAAYRALFNTAQPQSDIDEIRLHLKRQRAWGSETFLRSLPEWRSHPAPTLTLDSDPRL